MIPSPQRPAPRALPGRGRVRASAALLSWVLVSAVAAAVVAATAAASRAQQAEQADAPTVARGAAVYAQYCAACHGTDGAGQPGTDVTAGPPLRDTSAAYNDLLVRTGRMPIVSERAGITRDPLITDVDRTALVAWLVATFDLPANVPVVGGGDPGRGQALYAQHCAACHGATGSGGIASAGTYVRAVRGVDRVAVAEAIRVGPFTMPRFEEAVLSDQDVADVAAFTTEGFAAPTATPLGLVELNRVAMAALAGGLGVVLLAVVFALARRPPSVTDVAPAPSAADAGPVDGAEEPG